MWGTCNLRSCFGKVSGLFNSILTPIFIWLRMHALHHSGMHFILHSEESPSMICLFSFKNPRTRTGNFFLKILAAMGAWSIIAGNKKTFFLKILLQWSDKRLASRRNWFDERTRRKRNSHFCSNENRRRWGSYINWQEERLWSRIEFFENSAMNIMRVRWDPGVCYVSHWSPTCVQDVCVTEGT